MNHIKKTQSKWTYSCSSQFFSQEWKNFQDFPPLFFPVVAPQWSMLCYCFPPVIGEFPSNIASLFSVAVIPRAVGFVCTTLSIEDARSELIEVPGDKPTDSMLFLKLWNFHIIIPYHCIPCNWIKLKCHPPPLSFLPCLTHLSRSQKLDWYLLVDFEFLTNWRKWMPFNVV